MQSLENSYSQYLSRVSQAHPNAIRSKQIYKPQGFSVYIFLCLLAIWTTTLILAILVDLPNSVRGLLISWKNIFGALTVTWALTNIVISQMRHRKLLPFDSNLFLLSLCLPIYITAYSISIDVSWPEVVFYWLWATAAFMACPVFLHNKRYRHRAIHTILWSNVVILLLGIYLGLNTGSIYWPGERSRMVFNFINPLPYAAALQINVPLCIYLITQKSEKLYNKFALMSLAIATIILIYLASARGSLIFIICFLLSYFAIVLPWKRILKVSISFVLFSIFMILIVSILLEIKLNFYFINEISSGRLLVWRNTLDYNLHNASVWEYLIGLGDYKILGFGTFDLVSLDYRFSRTHMDNAYLGLFLQFGLIGLSFFLLPLAITYQRSWNFLLNSTKEDRSIYAIMIGCWHGIFLQMMVMPLIPSFGNSMNIFIIMVLMPTILGISKR